MKRSLPPWDCRSAVDRARFEDCTNDELDRFEEASLAEACCDPAADRAVRFFLCTRFLDAAIERGDVDEVVAMLDDRELRRFDTQRRLATRRGRPPGSGTMKWRLSHASEKVDWVRKVWSTHYGRTNRTSAPTAIDIVVRRLESARVPVARSALENLRRQQGRFRPE